MDDRFTGRLAYLAEAVRVLGPSFRPLTRRQRLALRLRAALRRL